MTWGYGFRARRFAAPRNDTLGALAAARRSPPQKRRQRVAYGLSRLSAFCREHPDDWGCRQAHERLAAAGPAGDPPQAAWVHDGRIKAAVIAAPASGYAFTPAGLAAVKAPVQLWWAEDDRIVPRVAFDTLKSSLPTPPEMHLVPMANHFDFLAPCSGEFAERVPEVCRDAPGFDRAAFHQDFNRAVIGFFQTHLAR